MLSYERLRRISLTEKPYRGSKNRFPVTGRRQNNKYFLAEEENGETIFKVVYGHHYEQKPITPEEATELEKEGKSVYHDTVTGAHALWVTKPCVIGVVRSDETFEFTARSYAQGARKFLSDMSHGYFHNDSRRGGMVFSSSPRLGFYPIHRGMRVNVYNMKPTKDITIIGKTVDRKAAKKLMSQHKDFYTVTETMCKAMTLESWLDTAKTIFLENEVGDKQPAQILMLAEAMKSTAPLDALVLYALGVDSNFRWRIKHPSTWHSHRTAVEMFDSVKARLNRQIYKENEDTFKTVTYEMGKVYPPSEWGYTLVVDGVEVEQYGYGV